MLPVGGWCKRTAVLQSLPASVLRIFNQNTVPLNKSSLITLPVQWGDMDAFKHLNNVAMMRYFESARVSHFQQVIYPKLYTQVDSDNHAPMEVGAMDYHGVGPIVKTIVCNYRAQVTFPDTLTLACWVPQETIGKDRFEQLFLAVSHKDQRICADGKALMVTFDYRKGQKSLVPKAVLEALLGVIGG